VLELGTIELLIGSPTALIHIHHMHWSTAYTVSNQSTRSHPEMVGDMSRVTLNSDISKIPFVHF